MELDRIANDRFLVTLRRRRLPVAVHRNDALEIGADTEFSIGIYC